MAKANKRANARAKKLGEKAAQAYTRKMAQGDTVQAVPVPAYRYAQDRGDLYDADPAVRALAWQASQGAWLAKSRSVVGGVSRGQLAFWQAMADAEPDPGVREAIRSAIFEATGGAQ